MDYSHAFLFTSGARVWTAFLDHRIEMPHALGPYLNCITASHLALAPFKFGPASVVIISAFIVSRVCKCASTADLRVNL